MLKPKHRPKHKLKHKHKQMHKQWLKHKHKLRQRLKLKQPPNNKLQNREGRQTFKSLLQLMLIKRRLLLQLLQASDSILHLIRTAAAVTTIAIASQA